MPHANFAFVKIDQHLGDVEDEINTSLEFKGKSTDVSHFTITGVPRGDGYLLIQAFDVGVYSHEILINGEALPSHDIPPHKGLWQTRMDFIPAGRLKKGANSIQIVRGNNEITTGADKGDDNFLIQGVAIHWVEAD